MSHFTVVFDACVLYPVFMRDLLMHLATTGLFRAKWTEQIQEEWSRNVLLNRPDIDPAKIKKSLDSMAQAIPDAFVTGYECLIPTLDLPDPDDRHVLATAIHSNAATIVTFNLKDFPKSELDKYYIEAQHPDDFVVCQFDLNPGFVFSAVKKQRKYMVNPPMDVDSYLRALEDLGMPQTVALLDEYTELI